MPNKTIETISTIKAAREFQKSVASHAQELAAAYPANPATKETDHLAAPSDEVNTIALSSITEALNQNPAKHASWPSQK